MEKQARKRPPASRSDEEAEVKNARARTLDDDVEEFFAIIRKMRATSRPPGNAHSNHRNPSFQAEDFAAFCEGSSAADGARRGGSGRRQSMSDRDQEEEVEVSEDNESPASRSLNIGSCGGVTRQLSMKRRAGSSETEARDTSRCTSGGSY